MEEQKDKAGGTKDEDEEETINADIDGYRESRTTKGGKINKVGNKDDEVQRNGATQ